MVSSTESKLKRLLTETRRGMPLWTDGERAADMNDPKGYFEWEALKRVAKELELLDDEALLESDQVQFHAAPENARAVSVCRIRRELR